MLHIYYTYYIAAVSTVSSYLQVLVIGNISSDKVFVEPHYGVQMEYHGDRSEAADNCGGDADLIWDGSHKQTSSV